MTEGNEVRLLGLLSKLAFGSLTWVLFRALPCYCMGVSAGGANCADFLKTILAASIQNSPLNVLKLFYGEIKLKMLRIQVVRGKCRDITSCLKPGGTLFQSGNSIQSLREGPAQWES